MQNHFRLANAVARLALPALLLYHGQLLHARGDNFPPPPGAAVQWVSQDMVYNGMPMSIRHFKTDQSTEEVLAFYRKKWRTPITRGLPGFVEAANWPWQIISRIEPREFLSVQVQPLETGKGSWGYLGVSRKGAPDGDGTPGGGVPMMRSTRVINDLRSADPGISARTLQLANKFSATANASYYRKYYRNAGWTVVVDEQNRGTWVQTFENGRKQVNLVIRVHDGATVVVANFVTRSLFR